MIGADRRSPEPNVPAVAAMLFMKRMTGISWTVEKTNYEVLRVGNIQIFLTTGNYF